MNTKLTLRLDDKVIRDAKKIANARKVSLSLMVSEYFKSIASQRTSETIESPVLSEIAGILSSKTDTKKLLRRYKGHIERKYL